MVATINHTTLDCTDSYALCRWWQQVLDYVDDPDNPNRPGDTENLIMSRDGKHKLLFIDVPEAKQVKNRMHFDLTPVDRTRDEEVERLIALGAKPVDDKRLPDGRGWFVLADPEGNEFCVERSQAERAAAG